MPIVASLAAIIVSVRLLSIARNVAAFLEGTAHTPSGHLHDLLCVMASWMVVLCIVMFGGCPWQAWLTLASILVATGLTAWRMQRVLTVLILHSCSHEGHRELQFCIRNSSAWIGLVILALVVLGINGLGDVGCILLQVVVACGLCALNERLARGPRRAFSKRTMPRSRGTRVHIIRALADVIKPYVAAACVELLYLLAVLGAIQMTQPLPHSYPAQVLLKDAAVLLFAVLAIEIHRNMKGWLPHLDLNALTAAVGQEIKTGWSSASWRGGSCRWVMAVVLLYAYFIVPGCFIMYDVIWMSVWEIREQLDGGDYKIVWFVLFVGMPLCLAIMYWVAMVLHAWLLFNVSEMPTGFVHLGLFPVPVFLASSWWVGERRPPFRASCSVAFMLLRVTLLLARHLARSLLWLHPKCKDAT